MTRVQSDRNISELSDRNVSADAPKHADDRERFAERFDQTEIAELFDDTIRLRFGKVIAKAMLKSGRR
jgi:hypothetical protein